MPLQCITTSATGPHGGTVTGNLTHKKKRLLQHRRLTAVQLDQLVVLVVANRAPPRVRRRVVIREPSAQRVHLSSTATAAVQQVVSSAAALAPQAVVVLLLPLHAVLLANVTRGTILLLPITMGHHTP